MMVMRKERRQTTAILAGLFLASLLFPKETREQNFDQKYNEFLKLTAYIILPKEKSVFLKLESYRDRDIFIETFWKQRDPTPGTPQNEYKEELIKRFNYVNKLFGRGTSREGWMTDQGKFYMILGEPASKHDFSERRGIYPCQVWYYYGDKEGGLPAHFGLVFFKRKGIGEFRLYDPVSDGISSLLMNMEKMSYDDYQAQYQKLEELVPDLAPVALSIIPGEIPYDFMPSTLNTMLVSDILKYPKKDINPNYATHFLDYKGMVSTEYMTNYIDNTASVDFLRDPLSGMEFLNFVIAPKTLSFDYYAQKNQYFCNFQLNVSLRKGEDIVFQYSKDFPIYFLPEEAGRIKANGLSIEDSFPVVQGNYKLILLLQNSVGKEFTVFEKDVSIPEPEGRPRIVGPVVGYEFRTYDPDSHLPYKLLDKKLLIDPSFTFSPAENICFFLSLSEVTAKLWEEGRISIALKGLRPNNPSQKSLLIKLNTKPYNKILSFMQTISASELSPDYYEMSVLLTDISGKTIDGQKVNFAISTDDAVPHPVAQVKMIPKADKAPFYFMLANQNEKIGNFERAEALYQQGHEMSPDQKRGLIQYAYFLIKIKKYEKSLEMIETIKNDLNLRFDYFLAKGLAYMDMGKYAGAIENLLEGNKIYNSDVILLNSLGTCYYRIGQKGRALDALKASLRLNPDQEDIKILIAEIDKKIR